MTKLRRAGLPLTVAAVLGPFVEVAWRQRARRWTPVFDLAMIELRVRDASVGRWPLLGLVGRIGTGAHVGSHPGPLAFYVMAPVYRLLGSSSWAFQAASLASHATAAGVAVLIGYRRARLGGAVAVAMVLAVLVQGYGMGTMAEPWNPFLPVLWFMVFLVATWSVLDGDRPMLLVAVFAASFCTQTHIPYLAVTAGLLAIGALACVLVDRATWRRGAAWVAAGAVLGLVLWTPPLVDQATADPGNLSVLADYFGTPPQAPVGFRAGGRLLAERLDLWHLAVRSPAEPGQLIGILHRAVPSPSRGVAFLALWAASAAASVAFLRRRRTLLALHAVVAVGVPVAWVAASRIFGEPMYYLLLWAWGLAAVMGLATAWTVAELGRRWAPSPVLQKRVGAAVTVLALLVVAGLSTRLLLLPGPQPLGQAVESDQLRRLLPATVRGLDAAGGRSGRWLVTWTDVAYLGAQGYGLVNELERAGFDVGVVEEHRLNFLDHRYLPTAEAAGRVHLATGTEVERWARAPGAQRIAYDPGRAPAAAARYDEIYRRLTAELTAAGLYDLVDKLSYDLWSAAFDPRLTGPQSLAIGQLQNLGVPAAVYLLPPDAQPPAPQP